MNIFLKSIIMVFALFYFITCYGQRSLASINMKAENVSKIDIRGSFCDVIVRSGSSNFVKGVIEGSGREGDYDFIADIEGETLIVRVENRYNKSNSITKGEIELTISDIDELLIDNSSGDINVEAISIPRVYLETSSGELSVLDLIGSEAYLRSSSGDIILKDVEANAKVQSSSGDQRIREIKGDLDAESSSGNIALMYFDGKVRIESTSGDINVNNGKGLAGLRTTSGTIEGADLMLVSDLTIQSTSGDISLYLMNDPDDLSFDLESNSGDLEVGRYDAEDELYIKTGSIWVRGRSTSGDISIDY